jgi:adhesin transport system outer membrane protein
MSTGGGDVSRFLSKDSAPKMTEAEKEAAESVIISDLQARRSVLPPHSAYTQVAAPVLEAYSRPAEAELRSARLRAKAASKNWLPRIGPNISLTSLSDIVAQLVVEQVLFDNGRKKAERAFAKADVEAAAVTLAEHTNERVFSALTLYLEASKARERRARQGRRFGQVGFERAASEAVGNPVDHRRAERGRGDSGC